MIFDIVEGAELEINGKDSVRVCDPIIERALLDTTYDRILSIYIIDENMSEEVKMLDCWVILQSSQYGQIHLVKLHDMQKKEDIDKNANEATLGGNFVEGKEVMHIKIEEAD